MESLHRAIKNEISETHTGSELVSLLVREDVGEKIFSLLSNRDAKKYDGFDVILWMEKMFVVNSVYNFHEVMGSIKNAA
jgi:hypothetical protein